MSKANPPELRAELLSEETREALERYIKKTRWLRRDENGRLREYPSTKPQYLGKTRGALVDTVRARNRGRTPEEIASLSRAELKTWRAEHA